MGRLEKIVAALYKKKNACRVRLIPASAAGPLTDIHGLEDLGVFYKQANKLVGSGLPGTDTNLTLDMSGNAFSGTFPHWLFHAIVRAPTKVTVNLAVRAFPHC